MTALMEGKAGLVTGSAGGIGRATAIALAREGAAVVVSDLEQSRSGGEETVEMIEREGGRARFVACDVSSVSDQEALVAETTEAFGSLDFAHNNAGVEASGPLTELDERDFDMIMNVNLKGVWLGMKVQIPVMLDQGGGSIVNTSSLAGLVGAPELAAYSASKHGVLGLTKTGAAEFADKGIRVNAICPAAIRTPMVESMPREQQEQLMAPQAMKRFGEPSEVAEAVVWLCSDRSSFVTGSSMAVDAGATAI